MTAASHAASFLKPAFVLLAAILFTLAASPVLGVAAQIVA